MRLVVFKQEGAERLGFVSGKSVIDPNLALSSDAPERAFFVDTIFFIRSGAFGRAAAERLVKAAPASAHLPVDSLELVRPSGLRQSFAAVAITAIITAKSSHADQREGAGILYQNSRLRHRPERTYRL
jgi:hypothetical protein